MLLATEKEELLTPKQSNLSQNNLAGFKRANTGILVSFKRLNNHSSVTVLQNYKEQSLSLDKKGRKNPKPTQPNHKDSEKNTSHNCIALGPAASMSTSPNPHLQQELLKAFVERNPQRTKTKETSYATRQGTCLVFTSPSLKRRNIKILQLALNFISCGSAGV